MINKQANILFIPTSIGGNRAEPQLAINQYGYYQQSIYASLARNKYTVEGFQVLGWQLAAIARHAWAAKQLDAVEQASQVMLALPIAFQLESIARYYQALCAWHRGDTDTARRSLERVVEEAPPQYRARALQIIGLTYHQCGEVDAALPFYQAAAKASANGDLSTLVESQRTTALVRSIHGDHKQALGDLERIFPSVRAIAKYHPVLYYEFLNSLAVELGEVGRIAEANAACAIAVGSPYAPAYPGWSETRDEIAAKRIAATRSVVAVNRAPEAIPSLQVKRKLRLKSIRKHAILWSSCKNTLLQRASKTIASVPPIPNDAVTQSILDWMLICIAPRAPPLLPDSISDQS